MRVEQNARTGAHALRQQAPPGAHCSLRSYNTRTLAAWQCEREAGNNITYRGAHDAFHCVGNRATWDSSANGVHYISTTTARQAPRTHGTCVHHPSHPEAPAPCACRTRTKSAVRAYMRPHRRRAPCRINKPTRASAPRRRNAAPFKAALQPVSRAAHAQ
eukprot:TRINITY_DN49413_c0_g1_i1.p1 TRINITY_DN49413_c0_g1~~TRINITY_DN49413_c0_g1_i1.p1  ORF type:complete len:160 (-),score=14.89 TRINITY_DN49413_c0_g1_i1:118-597(-)